MHIYYTISSVADRILSEIENSEDNLLTGYILYVA